MNDRLRTIDRASDALALFQGRIARYKHPREVSFLDRLPRSPLGKVQRELLREAFRAPAHSEGR